MKKILLTFLVCLLLFTLGGCECEHEWEDATCQSPKECSICGETKGKALPHTWTDATCSAPKECTVCGTTEGDALPHTWTDATCQSPKQCTVCGTIEGGVLSHTWTDATCSAPKTCAACNATDGEKLAHTPTNEWVVQKTDYIYAETVKVQTCSICGEVVEREIIDLTKLHDNTYFLISPDDFTTRLGNTLASYTGNNYKTTSGTAGESYACGVTDSGDTICVLLFTKNDDIVTSAKRNDSGAYNKVMGQCNPDAIARVSCAMIQATDPTISLDNAKKYAEQLLKYDSVSVNGVKYVAVQYSDKYIIGFTIE